MSGLWGGNVSSIIIGDLQARHLRAMVCVCVSTRDQGQFQGLGLSLLVGR